MPGACWVDGASLLCCPYGGSELLATWGVTALRLVREAWFLRESSVADTVAQNVRQQWQHMTIWVPGRVR